MGNFVKITYISQYNELVSQSTKSLFLFITVTYRIYIYIYIYFILIITLAEMGFHTFLTALHVPLVLCALCLRPYINAAVSSVVLLL